MTRPGVLAPFFALVLSIVPLAGCDSEEEETVATEALEGETARDDVAVWTFAPDIAEDADALANRLPAEPSRMILVPATSLFPGMARIDPQVENPFSGDPDAEAAGERHFAAFNCSGCHAPLGGGGMAPPLSDEEWIYGSEPAQIFLTIMHGRGDGMPAFGSMLPAQTVWELVSYIETLSEIEDYAAELGFDENVGGFRETTEDEEDQEGDDGGQAEQ